MFDELFKKSLHGDKRSLARLISLIENEYPGYEGFLSSLAIKNTPVIGITGPPGAGKSTLISALLQHVVSKKPDARIAVMAVDPTSPFTHGALLGDRLRMQEHFNNEHIYIRSLATRGALGGLSGRALEVSYVLKAAGFDYIFIETVGVGQSEVDIVALADITVVVFVPESGDEIQALKSGIMEIAAVFAVNKADRDGASSMVKNIQAAMHERNTGKHIPVLKTIATRNEGIASLFDAIMQQHQLISPAQKNALLAEHAYRLIQHNRMKDIDRVKLLKEVEEESGKTGFNIYSLVQRYG